MGRRNQLLVTASIFFVTYSAHAQDVTRTGVFSAALGTSEHGAGTATVKMTSPYSLRIDADYYEMDGLTTEANLHCCAQPGSTAGPVLREPIAVTPASDTYAHTVDSLAVHLMQSAAAWNEVFLRDSGGTADQAWTKLKTSLMSGEAYLNVKSNAHQNGDIRANLIESYVPISVAALESTSAPTYTPRDVRVGTMTKECERNKEQCGIPVYVEMVSTNSCEVSTVFKEILVPSHQDAAKRIQVVWLLTRKKQDDATQYRFNQFDGVRIPSSTGQSSPLDRTRDFNLPAYYESDRQSFKWNSVHATPTDPKDPPKVFSYDVVVEWYYPSLKKWIPCRTVDPTISNK